jgi:hypothetical protein
MISHQVKNVPVTLLPCQNTKQDIICVSRTKLNSMKWTRATFREQVLIMNLLIDVLEIEQMPDAKQELSEMIFLY